MNLAMNTYFPTKKILRLDSICLGEWWQATIN
jgi:hypothetical protein